ncbi:BTAD domain-containing putative transcriptional regulator [Micromonospora sp. NPDC006766]|uniref:BTAD domain-containing putative transcriptional regulator n=1 Tax=Micromonospora sp. NPDC006766 TaxID=3154778 RepID=UPI0033C1D11C
MRVGILGPLEVRDGDQIVEVTGARLRALLIRLALDPGRPVGVSTLAEALWGDTPPADTANAVQSLVSRLRRAVPGLGVLSGPTGYRLDLGPDDVDAKRFERLTRVGREALRAEDAGQALAALRDALALWRGPALVDVADAAYAIAAAGRLEELRLTAQEDRIEAELRIGHPALLVAELDELTAAHPLREPLAVLHMRALAAAGRPAEALTAYERIRQRLADALGVDPSPELRAAHLALLRGEAAPPPAKVAAPRGNLRAALTTFVGRDEDLRQLTKQLAEHRLVTLVGPGGAGKTRLAGAAAGMLSDGIAGGAWLVELASITDPADVPRAVLDALGRRDRALETARPAPRDTMGRLVDALLANDTLIVLDNCEHVIDAAAQLTDELLGRCPGLRILATSREPLGILGEALDPVPPLRLPPADVTPVEALAYPSVQLLRDRAVAVRPGFAVIDGNVGDVVEICRRLDGLPLAIELAAARLRTLSPRQVAAGLDDRFRLLTGGSRTALPCHRTLRAVVDWSWGLLTDDERRLIERLAVFPSSITADSAAGVAGGDAASLLDALVDKSLLQIVGDGRFRMLETIREYGLERLAEVGGVAAARAAHTAYFLHLVQTADPHLRTAGQLPWLRLLEAERDNIVGALHFACDAGDADTALRIGAALALPLAIWGDGGIGGDVLARALTLPGPALVAERAIVVVIRMITEMFSGSRMPEEPEVAELTAAIRAAHGSTNPYVALLEPALAIFTDDTSAGIAAVDRARGHADPWVDGTLLALRGQIKENDGDAEGMLRDLTQATKELRAVGERWSLSGALTSYADALTKRGDFAAATAALEESVRLSRELNPADEPGNQVIWLAAMRARSGDVAGAKESLRRFVADRATDRAGHDVAFGLTMLGDIARTEGSLDEARECFAEAMRRVEAVPMGAPQFRATLLTAMGHLALADGDAATARRWVAEAVDCGKAAHDMPVVAIVTVGWVAIAAAESRYELAAELLGTSDSLRGRPDRSNLDAQRLAEQLRAELGDEAYAAAYARGHGLSRADALAFVGTDPVR